MDSTPENPYGLTMEQRFKVVQYERELETMSPEELRSICLEIIRQKYGQMNAFMRLGNLAPLG